MAVMDKQSTTPNSAEQPTVERGADVARDLGWPDDRFGLFGAFAGLVDVGSTHWRRESSLTRMRRQHADTKNRVLRHMARTTQRLSPR